MFSYQLSLIHVEIQVKVVRLVEVNKKIILATDRNQTIAQNLSLI